VIRRWLPDLLTLARLASAPFLTWLLLEREYRGALALAAAAGVTDWLDGFAARRLHASGPLGVVLDPFADKVLLVVLFLTLGWVRLIPGWLVALVIGRDVVIVLGAALLRITRGIRRFLPSLLGKISTFFQIALVVSVLSQAAFPSVLFALLKSAAIVLTCIFTVASGVAYVLQGIRMAQGKQDDMRARASFGSG